MPRPATEPPACVTKTAEHRQGKGNKVKCVRCQADQEAAGKRNQVTWRQTPRYMASRECRGTPSRVTAEEVCLSDAKVCVASPLLGHLQQEDRSAQTSSELPATGSPRPLGQRRPGWRPVLGLSAAELPAAGQPCVEDLVSRKSLATRMQDATAAFLNLLPRASGDECAEAALPAPGLRSERLKTLPRVACPQARGVADKQGLSQYSQLHSPDTLNQENQLLLSTECQSRAMIFSTGNPGQCEDE